MSYANVMCFDVKKIGAFMIYFNQQINKFKQNRPIVLVNQ